MNDETGAVVLLSGGLDSSVLLHYVASRLGRKPVHALSFNYGQRHSKELACAHAQAGNAGALVHQVIDASFLGALLKHGSVLLEGGKAVPDFASLDAEELKQPPTYVPNRNMMLLAMAAAYAEAHEMQDVFYGAQAQGEYGYWDCTKEFLERLNATFSLNRKRPVTVHAPFVAWAKKEIVVLGTELEVNFGDTWSCYRGGDTPCGTCPTCVERANAFRDAGVVDPLVESRS